MTAVEFEIRVTGALPQNVLTELGGVRVVTQSLETVLQAPVQDQAALIGIINRLQSLGVEIRGVRQLGTPAASTDPQGFSPFDSTQEPSERDPR